MKLKGKTAVITGAGSGFGEGIAKMLAYEACRVIVADINVEGGKRVAGEIDRKGGQAIFVEADVSKTAGAEAMISAAKTRFGGLDILVNNAGYTHLNKPLADVDEEEFDRIFAVNVKAIYLAARVAVPLMRQQGGGSIINTSSTAALRPRPGLTWYNGSKGAVNTITKSMAVELAPDKIRVNALCPVIGETGMMERFMGGSDSPERREKFQATIPLGRFSTPDDIAAAALYFASPEAEFVTGVCMEIDGGRCI